jgi:hypothetical protein
MAGAREPAKDYGWGWKKDRKPRSPSRSKSARPWVACQQCRNSWVYEGSDAAATGCKWCKQPFPERSTTNTEAGAARPAALTASRTEPASILLQCGLSKDDLGEDTWQLLNEAIAKRAKQQQDDDEAEKVKTEKPQVLVQQASARLAQALKAKEVAKNHILQLAADTEKLHVKMQDLLSKLPAAEEKLQQAVEQVEQAEQNSARCHAAARQRKPAEHVPASEKTTSWQQQREELLQKLAEVDAKLEREKNGMDTTHQDEVPGAAAAAGPATPPAAAAAAPAAPPATDVVPSAAAAFKEQLEQRLAGSASPGTKQEERERERSPRRAGHDKSEQSGLERDPIEDDETFGEDAKSDFASVAGSVGSTAVATAAKRMAAAAAEGQLAKAKVTRAAAKAATGNKRG